MGKVVFIFEKPKNVTSGPFNMLFECMLNTIVFTRQSPHPRGWCLEGRQRHTSYRKAASGKNE